MAVNLAISPSTFALDAVVDAKPVDINAGLTIVNSYHSQRPVLLAFCF